MEKRVLLALALSALVFLAIKYYEEKYVVKAPADQSVEKAAVKEPEKKTQAIAVEAAPAAKPAVAPSTSHDTKASARVIEVAGNKYHAVIDNKGGVLTSWKLKNYISGKDESDKDIYFEMIVGNKSSEGQSFPAALIFQDPSLTALANKEFYQVSIESGSDHGGPLIPPATVILKLKRGDLSIEKQFRFEKDNYLFDLSMTCEKGGKALDGRFILGEDLGPEKEHLITSAKLEAVYYAGGDVQRKTPPKNEQEIQKIEGDVRWVGLNIQYFAMIVIPDRPLPYFDIQKCHRKDTERDLIRITTPESGSLQYKIYLGPKMRSDLEAVKSADLTGVINYGYWGMISILVRPLIASLRWIYQFVHNYGYAIIILTFLLSLLLFPFRLKQMISMKKMQVVQPKVKVIQEKYRKYKKTDPKRTEMNQEIMALYKEHNVNPLGGCLPLLLQMPLLFAFYSLLANSIELRHAPFIFWIQDLSVMDEKYVLPIVMGITMFISQKMTPMTPGTDPTQAKMMMAMPVVFTFMFSKLSSGLNLYFLCSNIFQIAFQKIAERWIGDGKSQNK
jgi:YidC/Oxa1 family membrane protein insertase